MRVLGLTSLPKSGDRSQRLFRGFRTCHGTPPRLPALEPGIAFSLAQLGIVGPEFSGPGIFEDWFGNFGSKCRSIWRGYGQHRSC